MLLDMPLKNRGGRSEQRAVHGGGRSGCVVQVILQLREKRKPMIIDADGLYITTKDLGLLKGYDLAILTPNKYAIPIRNPGAGEA
jgi:hypothetical protein